MAQIRYKVSLTQEERDRLEAMATRGKHSSQSLLNALILLACDEGPFQESKRKAEEIAAILPVSLRKIDRVRRRFVEQGLEVALEKQPAQREYRRKADGDFEARLVALSCSEPPKGHVRWSLRLLADKMVELEYVDTVSYETVRRFLKKTL